MFDEKYDVCSSENGIKKKIKKKSTKFGHRSVSLVTISYNRTDDRKQKELKSMAMIMTKNKKQR